MEILWWLAPPVLVTLLAMVAVSWFGREGRGEIGRDEAVRRVGVALERHHEPARAPVVDDGRDPDGPRSRGVVVRRAPAGPVVTPVVAPVEVLPVQAGPTAHVDPGAEPAIEPDETVRRAS